MGNGQSCLEPLDLDKEKTVSWENIEYRIAEHRERLALYYRPQGEDWKPRFTFTRLPRQLEEFAELCHHNQVSPDSLFTQNRLATIAREGGRVNLVGRNLEVVRDGQVEKEQLASIEDYNQALKNHFDIHLPGIPAGW